MSTRGSTGASIPQMKASHMQSNVVCLALLGEAKEAEVRAACSEIIAEIDASIRSTWLPVELDVVLTQAVEDICGAEATEEWARQAVYQSAKGPLMGPIIGGLTRLGLGPRHGLRRVPAVWNLIYRNCGSMSCEADPGVASLVLKSPTPKMNDTYLRGIGAAFEGLILILGSTVTESTAKIEAGEVRYRVRWSRPNH
ncbi:MAG: hypothetical protein AB8H86_06945 [Polyangiales bacterium]